MVQSAASMGASQKIELNHNYAASIADHAIDELANLDGNLQALVVVTLNQIETRPLSVRTLVSRGWGANTDGFTRLQRTLMHQATLQAMYAASTNGRTAADQNEYLKKSKGRTAAAYNIKFPPTLQANFARDEDMDLVVTVVSESLDVDKSIRIAEQAIMKAKSEVSIANLPQATQLIYACLRCMHEIGLPPNRVGFVQLTQSRLASRVFDEFDDTPMVIASQSMGEGSLLGGYDVLSAKTKAAALSGLPSGSKVPDGVSRWADGESIPGALLVQVTDSTRRTDRGQYILGVGGLSDSMKDVEAVIHAVASVPWLGIHIIKQLAGFNF